MKIRVAVSGATVVPLFPVKFGTPDATHLALPCISGASLALPPPDPSHAPLTDSKGL